MLYEGNYKNWNEKGKAEYATLINNEEHVCIRSKVSLFLSPAERYMLTSARADESDFYLQRLLYN